MFFYRYRIMRDCLSPFIRVKKRTLLTVEFNKNAVVRLDFWGKIWYIEDMESTVKMIVAKNLIELRKRKNLTQGELAEMLNYSDKTISKWENGVSQS